jgi:hypothetical protein
MSLDLKERALIADSIAGMIITAWGRQADRFTVTPEQRVTLFSVANSLARIASDPHSITAWGEMGIDATALSTHLLNECNKIFGGEK